MKPTDSIAQVGQALRLAKHIIIIINSKPSIDQIVAGVGLANILNRTPGPRVNPTSKYPASPIKTRPGLRPTTNPRQESGRQPQQPATVAKNAVLMFAGSTPKKIDFLNPGPAIRPNLESYQDLVISIKKDKADRLRYDLDDDYARIHISPFRQGQGLTEKDLEIGKGDFNIDAIVTLGVTDIKTTDEIISKSPGILADRPAICLAAGDSPSRIAGDIIKEQRAQRSPNPTLIEWRDDDASCLSEMVFALAAELKVDIDELIAMTLLTGVIESTDCFKSEQADAASLRVAAAMTEIAGVANKKLIIENLAKVSPGVKSVASVKALESAKPKIIKPVKNIGLGIRANQADDDKKKPQEKKSTDIKPFDVLQEMRIGEDGRPIIGPITSSKPAAASPSPAPAPQPAAVAGPANPITDADKLGAGPAPASPAGPPISSPQTGPQPQLLNPDQFSPPQLASPLAQRPSDWPTPA